MIEDSLELLMSSGLQIQIYYRIILFIFSWHNLDKLFHFHKLVKHG